MSVSVSASTQLHPAPPSSPADIFDSNSIKELKQSIIQDNKYIYTPKIFNKSKRNVASWNAILEVAEGQPCYPQWAVWPKVDGPSLVRR